MKKFTLNTNTLRMLGENAVSGGNLATTVKGISCTTGPTDKKILGVPSKLGTICCAR